MLYQLSYARDGRKSKSPFFSKPSLRRGLAHKLVAISQYLHFPLERNGKGMGYVGDRYRNLGIRGANGVPVVVVEGEAQGDRRAGFQRLVHGLARNAATGSRRLEAEVVDHERQGLHDLELGDSIRFPPNLDQRPRQHQMGVVVERVQLDELLRVGDLGLVVLQQIKGLGQVLNASLYMGDRAIVFSKARTALSI